MRNVCSTKKNVNDSKLTNSDSRMLCPNANIRNDNARMSTSESARGVMLMLRSVKANANSILTAHDRRPLWCSLA